MNRKCRVLAFAVLLGSLTTAFADWPGFRGPHQDGVSTERGLPVTWSAKENVVWKTKLPGPGLSSPIVWGDRVFLTCYTGYGVGKEGDLKDLRRHLLCLDRKSGAVVWRKEVAAKLPETEYNQYMRQHGYASGTPATDGERVYVFFGRTGVLAFDLDGKQVWHTEVGTILNSWGSASSPVVYGDLLLVNATVESGALVALDRRSGKVVWRAKGIRDCWSTPLLVALPGGKHEVVLSSPDTLEGYDPENGKKLWECEGPPGATASSTPVAWDGVVYAMGGGFSGRLFVAVRAGGRGDVTKTHVLWKRKTGAAHTAPILHDGRLYWIGGTACCLKAATGEIVYEKRLFEARQQYSSPILADGRIYVFTRQGGAYVLAAGDKFEQLAHNDLGDASDFSASPAVSGGQLFIRSNTYAYCLGKKQ